MKNPFVYCPKIKIKKKKKKNVVAKNYKTDVIFKSICVHNA